MKQIIYIFLFSLTLPSCSTNQKVPEVEIVTLKKENLNNLKIDTSIVINEAPQGVAVESSTEELKAVKSLTIYSTLYSSLALVEFFKKSDKQKNKYEIITTNGFASIIAVLYAEKGSASLLEWKLFKLLKSIKGQKPFSKVWNRSIRNFLEKEFGERRLDSLTLKVGIPKIIEGEVELNTKGIIVTSVMDSLAMTSKNAFYLKPVYYRAPLNKLNVDIKYQISFVPTKFNFKNLEGYTWGIFTNYLSFIQDKPEDVLFISTEQSLWIDSINPLSDIIHAYSNSIEDALNQFIEIEKEWVEENTTSSINTL